jgi:hypothetical protein
MKASKVRQTKKLQTTTTIIRIYSGRSARSMSAVKRYDNSSFFLLFCSLLVFAVVVSVEAFNNHPPGNNYHFQKYGLRHQQPQQPQQQQNANKEAQPLPLSEKDVQRLNVWKTKSNQKVIPVILLDSLLPKQILYFSRYGREDAKITSNMNIEKNWNLTISIFFIFPSPTPLVLIQNLNSYYNIYDKIKKLMMKLVY